MAAAKKLKILVSNDDGIDSDGVFALADAFKGWGTVYITAPTQEKSTSGHSLTLHKPLRLYNHGKNAWAVSGSPADCIFIGINEVVGTRPDLVVSGVNRGANLAQDVYYSGTISAAREAALMGIPAMAVSLAIDTKQWGKPGAKLHFASGAKQSEKVLKKVLRSMGDSNVHTDGLGYWPVGMVLNVNVPNVPSGKIKGVKLARLGRRNYGADIIKRTDGRGKEYFWIGGNYQGFEPQKDTDCVAVHRNYVSVTPLAIDCTDYESTEMIRGIF